MHDYKSIPQTNNISRHSTYKLKCLRSFWQLESFNTSIAAVITPFRRLVLCAESRREMEEWISALKAASARDYYEAGEHQDFLSGHHHWYATSHARPTYCNVCREALSGNRTVCLVEAT
ncbi:unnamed protein product [Timema podura]|uniref:PH domain-containing protein n=1 Tax=Timema podura TaxID=61482 RepID=A0ABN7NYM7_TIMPD|nr:unnamed protein product [Timema podura]